MPDRNYAADMRLPAGKTCGDCVYIRRCKALFGVADANMSCDFYPSKFTERVVIGSVRTAPLGAQP